jgi:two-component sensor histidine kinase
VQFESAVPYGAGPRFVHADYVPDVRADGTVAGFYALITDISARKQAEEHTLTLLREVSHRAKNMLAVVQALARATGRDANPETFVKLFSARLTGLAISHDQLVASDWRGVDLRALIEAQVSAVWTLGTSRLSIAGPPLRLSAAASQILGMAMHELAANALQFGAMSSEDGRIEIDWQIESEGDRTLTLTWQERGGPNVVEPEHKGFGHTDMKRMVELGLRATVIVDYTAKGLKWRLQAPAAGLLQADFSPPQAAADAKPAGA